MERRMVNISHSRPKRVATTGFRKYQTIVFYSNLWIVRLESCLNKFGFVRATFDFRDKQTNRNAEKFWHLELANLRDLRYRQLKT